MPQIGWDHIIVCFVLLTCLSALLRLRPKFLFLSIFRKNSSAAFLVPLPFVILNGLHALYRNLPLENFVFFSVYISLPVLFLWMADKQSEKIQIWDIAAILCLWLPFDLPYIQASWTKLSYPIISVSAMIVALIAFGCLRCLYGINFDLRVGLVDLKYLLKQLGILIAFLLPLGLLLNFLAWNPNYKYMKFFPLVVLISLVTTALPEELLFRGILQNLLEKTFSNPIYALAITSILFGLAHLENQVGGYGWPNWRYAFMAAIAGWSYGKAYFYSRLNSRSLLVPALLHALVDAIWGTLLVKT